MTQKTGLIYVVFGATGHLSQKKIIPALFSLWRDKKLPASFNLITHSRRPWSNDDFRTFIRPALEAKKFASDDITTFLEKIIYVQGTFDTDEGYLDLKNKIEILAKDTTSTQVLYHLAVQPEFYATVAHKLGSLGLHYDNHQSISVKLLVEKPFGHDTVTAHVLEEKLEEFFSEDQIYRIDHYLAKQGLISFIEERRKNKELEAKLNSTFVDAINFRLLEQIGIEDRGEFYDTVGALRDVGQNHLLEMVASTLMSFDSNKSLAACRAEVLEQLENPSTLERAQYKGYLEESDVPKNSQTETYFKLETKLNTDRWNAVPLILEAGKRMKEKRSEIEMIFKDGTKKVIDLESIRKGDTKRDAYEILIEKAIQDECDFFVSIDEIYASWKFVTPLLAKLKEVPLR